MYLNDDRLVDSLAELLAMPEGEWPDELRDRVDEARRRRLGGSRELDDETAFAALDYLSPMSEQERELRPFWLRGAGEGVE